MRRYPHLVNRRGHYYFRMAVPVALRGKIGKGEIFHSLKTKDYQEAKVRVWGSLVKTQEAFRQLSQGISHEAAYALYDAPISLKSTKPQSPLLSAVYAEFLLECKGDREKTINKRKAALALWLEIVGDLPLADLAKNHSRDFKATLMRLPANRKQKYGNAPISTIDLEAIPEGQRLSPATINSQLLWMSGFIGWAINNGYYHAENPFKGLLVKDQVRPETKRLSFTDEQLQLLFSSPVYRGCRSTDVRGRYEGGSLVVKDSLYWVPLIALYSGARLQEICQLYVTDIRQEQGVWLFDFNDNGNDKSLKTASSRRKTPTPYKISDGKGLFLYITPSGSKSWRYKYRFDGKQQTTCLGLYPDLGLAEAREKHRELREMIAVGKNPAWEKKKRKIIGNNQETSFEAIARRWHKNKLETWTPDYAAMVLRNLENDIFPQFGKLPINQIEAPLIIQTHRRIQGRDAYDVAHRVLGYCRNIFDFARIEGTIKYNPAQNLTHALKKKRNGHYVLYHHCYD